MKHIDRRQIQTIFHYRQNKPSQRTGPVWQPVLMTNFPIILNRLTGMFSEDRSEFIASFDEYDLLIIDDLGVERGTEYAMEQMFFVIDSRYRSRRPMIITTNLKLSELKTPPDLAHARAGKENRKDNLQGSCPFQQYQHRNHER